MPENTVKVDRTTKWGNPFVIGRHGTQEECVARFEAMAIHGKVDAEGPIPEQRALLGLLREHINELRGRNLACWCEPGTPCHADTLLKLANT